ncbi:hypothetical protein RF11_14780 [Thelohanellus kitauei]|uniref:Tc1-like transposase DDE domain-containing protein n=1 Tax=Thelohanellus kitauei TaxID=669202 RepID=A0A0C2MZG2_THEKT|nr:hypothetical protein RF11_14780 [Thelohanellus kitauei]
MVDENCSLTLQHIAQNILTRFNISLSKTTIDECLRELHYSFKSIHTIPIQRSDENTIRIRTSYAQSFLALEENYPDQQINFVDEVGFNVSMRSKKVGSLIGTTPVLRVPNIRSNNISVCCTMNRYDVVYKEVNNQAYNGGSFRGYIENFFLTL